MQQRAEVLKRVRPLVFFSSFSLPQPSSAGHKGVFLLPSLPSLSSDADSPICCRPGGSRARCLESTTPAIYHLLHFPQELYVWRARLDTSIVRCSGAVAATRLMLEQEVIHCSLFLPHPRIFCTASWTFIAWPPRLSGWVHKPRAVLGLRVAGEVQHTRWHCAGTASISSDRVFDASV